MRTTRLAACAAAMLTAASALGAAQAQRPAAELIVSDAKIWTGDARAPEAAALAVLDGRIVAIGSEPDVMAWRGPATQVVKAGGGRIVPGFNDAHVHVIDGATALEAIQLHDVTSAEEFTRRIGERAAHTPKGEWIIGGDWDETRWKVVALPTRQLIDGVAPDVPVAVRRYDDHMLVANSLALRLAGISAATPDPPGGVIVRDAQGEPTGALKDAAAELVKRVIPPLTHEQRRALIEHALRHAASLGVTSLQDMSIRDLASDYANIGVYAQLREEGKLLARVYVAPALQGVDDFTKLGLRRAFGDPWLRIGAFKSFADGSAGSRTAYFFEPYADNAQWRGLISDDLQPLSLAEQRMRKADAAGLQLCTHAIGDAAISTVLDLYAKVAAANGPGERRWRIEHAQHMAAADFARFASLGVIASVQPFHAIDDGRWIEERIGHERASRTYAFRTMLEHRIHVAFGTDWPVAPLDPMQTLYAATTRATLDGKNPGGWFPGQKLSIAEALTAYTQGSAYAEFQETEKGVLRAGALADFVLLSADVLAIDPARLREVKVLKTWVGGRLVYETGR